MTGRNTTLTMTGPDRIKLTSANGSMGLVVRDGKLFMAGVGGKELKLTTEKLAEVHAALSAYRPLEVAHTSNPAREPQYEWEFVSVINDAYGLYSRTVSEPVFPTVTIGRMDLA